MLEECRLPYVMKPVNISTGDQFKPEFLAISPNNRMPAIVDPDGPGGRAISVFESGAILQYLGRKTGKFYPADERARTEVDEWLFWQMGGLGPMSGQAHHFRIYAPEKLPYAIDRYTNEVHRLFGVMNVRLKDRPFLAGKYSIADMACVGWVVALGAAGTGHQRIPAPEALAGNGAGAAGGRARHQAARGRGIAGRYEGSERAGIAVQAAGTQRLESCVRSARARCVCREVVTAATRMKVFEP